MTDDKTDELVVYHWTKWPEKTGQQFIHYGGQTWVGVVESAEKEIDDGGLRITVWRGSGHYTIWSDHYKGDFRFQQISWPSNPK
jgi:hypothetical protein